MSSDSRPVGDGANDGLGLRSSGRSMDAGSCTRPVDGRLAGARPEVLARREALGALRRDPHRHPESGFKAEQRR
jgi:hypothetical protein